MVHKAPTIMCRKVIIMHEGARNGGFCAKSAENEEVLKVVMNVGLSGKVVAESAKMRGNIKIFSC